MHSYDPAQMLSDHLALEVTLDAKKAELALGGEVLVQLNRPLKDLNLNREKLVKLLEQAVPLNPNLLRGLTFQPRWIHEFGYGEWQVAATKEG